MAAVLQAEPDKPGRMKEAVSMGPQSGCLIYDSHCRLCVAVKRKFEQAESCGRIQFVPYESQRASECLGPHHQPGQPPPMAYWVDENGTIVGGLEAFLPLLAGLTSGKIFMFFWRFRVYRRLLLALYQLVARHRYRWFGVSNET